MKTKSLMYRVVFTISSFLYFSCAKEWSFVLPYYLLFGGIQESIDQPFREFVVDYGYPFEVHTDIQTEDGYLLTLFRIPYGIKNNNSHVKDKPVAFLFHGLFSSAEDWVVLGPERGLAFMLADAGYDVWLGNARGSMHSRKHVKYNPTWNGKFWDFSFHEIGYYDLKANIDYVLTTTKQKQLYYFGHSQGCTTFFILNSLRPEYNQRIKLMVALSPAVLISNTKSLALIVVSRSITLNRIIYALGFKEALAHMKVYSFLARKLCKERGLAQYICTKLHFGLLGGVSPHFNKDITYKVMQYQITSASFKQGIHYGQVIKYKRFCHYDHGKKKNLQMYGSESPPDYNLTNVVVPVAYYYGKHDIFCVPKDQKDSMRLFPNVVDEHLLLYKKFTHLDMVVGNDAIIFYKRALKLMQKY